MLVTPENGSKTTVAQSGALSNSHLLFKFVSMFLLSLSQAPLSQSPITSLLSPRSLSHLVSPPHKYCCTRLLTSLSPCVKFQLIGLFLLVRSSCTFSAEKPLQSAREIFAKLNRNGSISRRKWIHSFNLNDHWKALFAVGAFIAMPYLHFRFHVKPTITLLDVISIQVFVDETG